MQSGKYQADRAVVRALLVVASLTLASHALAQTPVTRAITWLNTRQKVNGTWGSIAELSPRDTARVVRAQLLHRSTASNVTTGVSWLTGQGGLRANEFLAEQCLALALTSTGPSAPLARLASQRQGASDFGGFPGYRGNSLDSALAVQAFALDEGTYATDASGVVSTLLARQNPDGGWGFDQGFASHPLFTAEVLIAVTGLKTSPAPPAAVSAAQQYLRGLVQADGSVAGDLLSTALVFRALAVSGFAVASLPASPLQYLTSRQAPDGSWGLGDVYLTSRVLEAYAADKPNLVVTALALSPTTVSDGATVSASLSVANTGTASSVATTVALTAAGGRSLASASLPALSPGASAPVSVTFTALQMLGAQTVTATVDPGNLADESSESDNQAQAALLVTGKPDLQVFVNDIVISPARLAPNQPGQLAVTFHNGGVGGAAGCAFSISLSSGGTTTVLESGTLTALAAGGAQQVTLPITLAAGSHTITAAVDTAGAVPETSELNNAASRTVSVSSAATIDLRILASGISVSPSAPAPGTAITITAKVENLGSDPADTTVAFSDGVWGAGGVEIASLPVHLDRQSAATLQATYTTTPGTSVIYVVADPSSLLPEIDKQNNVAYLPLTDQYVDLTVLPDGLVLPKAVQSAGQTVTGRVVVRNLGSLPATGVEVVLYDDLPGNGGLVVTSSLADVPPNGSTVVSGTWAARAGQRLATAVVNPSRSVSEVSYANNRRTRAYVVNGSGPDVWIDRKPTANPPGVDTSLLSIDPATLVVSGAVRAIVIGGGVNATFSVSLFEDVDGDSAYNPEVDNLLGSGSYRPGLDPQAVTVPAQGSVRFAPGRLLLYSDSGNAVAETNETNNLIDIWHDCFDMTRTFSPAEKWRDASTPVNTMPVVARLVDTNGDGVMDENDVPAIVHGTFGAVIARRGDTGARLWTHTDSWNAGAMTLAVGDVDGDGRAEVLAHTFMHRLVCLSSAGQVKWTSPELDRDPYWNVIFSLGYSYIGAPTIADLDGDGVPEVLSGRTCLNGATGQIKWIGTAGRGRAWANESLYLQRYPDQEVVLACDLDGDGVSEVVAGNTAYRANGQIYWYRSDLTDGYTAVFYLPSDPLPKICLVSNGKVYALNHDGTSFWPQPVPIPGGALMGGAPTVFMRDPDGPFIAVAGDTTLSAFYAASGALFWVATVSEPQQFNAAINSATVFRFGNGTEPSIVYQAIDKLVVAWAGAGSVLTYRDWTGPVYPYYPGGPVVADVDNDGAADIVAFGREGEGIYVLSDPTWNAAPAVFNQAAYHVVNTDENGAIPRREIETAFSRRHYRAQVHGVSPVRNLADVTVSYVRVATESYPASFQITARVGNTGSKAVPPGQPLTLARGYAGGPTIGVVRTVGPIPPGGYEDVGFTWSSPTGGTYRIYATAGFYVPECDGSNNTGSSLPVQTVADIATANEGLFVSDPLPQQSDVITLSANASLVGNVDRTKVAARFFLGATPISEALPATVRTDYGQPIASVLFPWTVDSAEGPQTIRCVWDPQNLVGETDETNNEAVQTIQVSARQEIRKLSGTLVVDPPGAERGTPVAVRVLLQNTGTVTLSGVPLAWSVSVVAGGASVCGGTAAVSSLAKLGYAELALGACTPPSEGGYVVALSSQDPAVSLLAEPKPLKIGPFVGAVLTAVPSHVPVSFPVVQGHVSVSRTNTVSIPDDPLSPAIQNAVQRGVSFLSPYVRYRIRDRCILCHVTGQALASLESSARVEGVTMPDATSQLLFDEIVSLQDPATGAFGGYTTQNRVTPTALTVFGLALYGDPAAVLPTLRKAMDFALTVQGADGHFDCSRCDLSYAGPEATTMMYAMGFARVWDQTRDPRYQAALEKTVQWALSVPYDGTPPERAARLSVLLSTALPFETNEGTATLVKARIASLLSYIKSSQNGDGTFGRATDVRFPIVNTAQCLYALALGGTPGTDPTTRLAITWLLSRQLASGAWDQMYYPTPWWRSAAYQVDASSWALLALPAAFRRLARLDAAVRVTLPPASDLASSNLAVASSSPVTGGTEYRFRLPNVSEQGTSLYFNVRLKGLTGGESRPVVSAGAVDYVDPYTGEPRTRPLAIPAVEGFAPLGLAVTTDRGSYGPSSLVTVSETVTNLGASTAGITTDVTIRDTNGTSVATVAGGAGVQGLPPSAFAGWHAVVPVTFPVQSAGTSRVVSFPVAFGALLDQAGIPGTFDQSSIRVAAADAPDVERAFSYKRSATDASSGTLIVSVPDGLAVGEVGRLQLYFDVLENGAKPVSPYDRTLSGVMAGSGLQATYWAIDRNRSNVYSTTFDGIRLIEPPVTTAIQPDASIAVPPAVVPIINWATVWTGALYAPVTGTYTFALGSMHGSWLSLDGAVVINNSGFHVPREITRTVTLTAGFHLIRVEWFYLEGASTILYVKWAPPGQPLALIPGSSLFTSAAAADPSAIALGAPQAITPGATTLTYTWSTGSTAAGTYSAAATLRQNGAFVVSSASAPFAITGATTFEGTISTDKVAYDMNETVRVSGAVSMTGNTPASGLTALLSILNPAGASVASGTTALPQITPGGSAPATLQWPLGAAPAGTYQAVLTLKDASGATLLTRFAPFAIRSTGETGSGVSGTLSVSAGSYLGQAVTFNATLTNAGNAPLESAPFVIRILTEGQALAATVSFTATVPVGGTVPASVSYATTPLGTGRFTAYVSMVIGTQTKLLGSASFEVLPAADLSIALSHAPASVAIGENVTFTAVATNRGPSAATSVSLVASVPAGATLVSATPSQGSCSGAPAVTCAIGALANGQSATLTLVVKAVQSGGLTVTSGVTAAETDLLPGNNSASDSVTVRGDADLSVTQRHAPEPALLTDTITFTITVGNAGPSDATNVTLTDTIPARSTLLSAASSQGGCSPSSPVTCNLGTVASGASATVTIRVSPNEAGTLTNAASVTATESDPVPQNNAASEGATVKPTADLAVAQTAAPDPIHAGETLTYTVTVLNLGPSGATGVTLAGTPPASATLLSVTSSQGSCTGSTSITCALGALAKGASATVTLAVRPTAAGRIENLAAVSSDQDDPAPANNTSRLSINVLGSRLGLDLNVGGVPRVLVLTRCLNAGSKDVPCAPFKPPALAALLGAGEMSATFVGDTTTFLSLIRAGSYSEVLLYQPLPAEEPKVAPELLEGIRAGLGLLVIKDSTDAMPKLAPALGAAFRGKLKGPTALHLLATPFTSDGTLTLNGDGVKIELGSALPVATLSGTSPPAISYNLFQRGRVVLIPFDTEKTPTADVGALLSASIEFVSATPSAPFIARQVIPIRAQVSLPAGTATSSVTTVITLPAGFSIVDSYPAATAATSGTSSSVTWTETLEGGSAARYVVWARLPDATGTFTVTASAGIGGGVLATQTLSLTVALDEPAIALALAGDLQALLATATGDDLLAVSAAKADLLAIQAIPSPGAADLPRILSLSLDILVKLDASTQDTAAARRSASLLLSYWQSRQ